MAKKSSTKSRPATSKQTRSLSLNIRVTPDEMELIKRGAELDERKHTDFARRRGLETILEAAREEIRKAEAAADS